MALPNPGMDAVPFTPLTAEFLDDMIENIQSLSSGTGLDDSSVIGAKIASYRVRRQDNTTNSNETAALIQTGWGVMATVAATTAYSETVTFPTAYTDKPIVVCSGGGDALTAAGTAYGTGANIVSSDWAAKAISITNTTFVPYLKTSSVGANGNVWYQWIAIGV